MAHLELVLIIWSWHGPCRVGMAHLELVLLICSWCCSFGVALLIWSWHGSFVVGVAHLELVLLIWSWHGSFVVGAAHLELALLIWSWRDSFKGDAAHCSNDTDVTQHKKGMRNLFLKNFAGRQLVKPTANSFHSLKRLELFPYFFIINQNGSIRKMFANSFTPVEDCQKY